MKKLNTFILSLIISFGFQVSAQAALVISNLNLTSSTLSLDVTGSLDAVNSGDLDSLFFGDVTQTTDWINSISYTSGFTKNSGTYDFNATGGNSNFGSYWGEYLYTNGNDTLVLGDIIDISVYWVGDFNVSAFDINTFVVQAGITGNPVFNSVAQIAGQVGDVVSVPAPTPLVLIGLGLLGLGFGRKKNHS